MTMGRNTRRRQLQPGRDARHVAVRSRPASGASDVAVQRLHHSEYELAHSLTPPHRFPAGYIRIPPLTVFGRAEFPAFFHFPVEWPDRNSTNGPKNSPATAPF